MRELKTVLVATDFSPAARTALRQAGRLCDSVGALLHVVHAVPSDSFKELKQLAAGSGEALETQVVELAQAKLADELGQAGVDAASTRAVLGSAVAGILGVAEEVGADLLMIGSHGTGGRRFGTVASRCMHKSPVSVLMVPEEQAGAFGQVVVGLDFSERSAETIENAVAVAQLDGASIAAFHTYDMPWDTGWGAAQPDNAKELEGALLNALNEKFAALVPEEANGLDVSFHAKCAIDYGKAIVDFAAKQEADLVVVGMTGRSGLGYFLLGSTAEKTMRDTTCAVLAVK